MGESRLPDRAASGRKSPRTLRPTVRTDFEIAIICAQPFEADAVDAVLDHRWESDDHGYPYGRAAGDPNAYSAGAIGRHNVVVAHLPGSGTVDAASAAASFRSSFPRIKLALVVGVCGAVPFAPDGDEIVLGDVIIAEGLIQFDAGDRLPGGFRREEAVLKVLGRPNQEIRALLAFLKVVRAREHLEERIASQLGALRAKSSRLAAYPGVENDELFRAEATHKYEGLSCEECGCGESGGQLVPRTRLSEEAPEIAVHFGQIASGDAMVQSGLDRDTIALQEGVPAFETEGAGVWDNFPCLVIKGVRDYADSHTTKRWSRYAAMTAAACMKGVLGYCRQGDHSTARQDPQARIGGSQQGPEPALQKRRRAFLNRLWPHGSKYEVQKDRNPDRVAGTCEWFLRHPRFRHWQDAEDSSFLWVTADPGCGKSVLAKFLVDNVLAPTDSLITCYFFFKDDFEDQKQATGALCAVLYQLFKQRPELLRGDMLAEHEEGQIASDFRDLWRILLRVSTNSNEAPIVCVLDALDECEESGRAELGRAINRYYGTASKDGPGHSVLKFIITSRPYRFIQEKFQPLQDQKPHIHLSGETEEEAKAISLEIDVVIRARVSELGRRIRLAEQDEQTLLASLLAMKHRTYIWAYLVFEVIEDDRAVLTKGSLQQYVSTLPRTAEEAYEKILRKSPNINRARKLLHIITVATRPFTVPEMAVALAINDAHESRSALSLDLFSPDQLHHAIREACGLFVVIQDRRIYLLHQTAREFLVQSQSRVQIIEEGSFTWRYSLRAAESHGILAEISMRYLLLSDMGTLLVLPGTRNIAT